MMRAVAVTFQSGELSLEGVLGMPDVAGVLPAVAICHPHPLYGGSMDNNVVDSVFEALARASIIPFKFNFRGVGRSQGEYGEGVGEQQDAGAAISFIAAAKGADPERLGLIGYSAGAAFALPVGCGSREIKALAAISPPLSMFDFDFLEGCRKPKLLVSGGGDAFAPAVRFADFCRRLPGPKECHTIAGADHFWQGYEAELAAKAAAFFAKSL